MSHKLHLGTCALDKTAALWLRCIPHSIITFETLKHFSWKWRDLFAPELTLPLMKIVYWREKSPLDLEIFLHDLIHHSNSNLGEKNQYEILTKQEIEHNFLCVYVCIHPIVCFPVIQVHIKGLNWQSRRIWIKCYSVWEDLIWLPWFMRLSKRCSLPFVPSGHFP